MALKQILESKLFLYLFGVKNAIFSLGGNVVLIGNKNGDGYSVGIADPNAPDTSTVGNINSLSERYSVPDSVRNLAPTESLTAVKSEGNAESVRVIENYCIFIQIYCHFTTCIKDEYSFCNFL